MPKRLAVTIYNTELLKLLQGHRRKGNKKKKKIFSRQKHNYTYIVNRIKLSYD